MNKVIGRPKQAYYRLVSYSLTIDPCVLNGVVYTRVVKSTDLVIIIIQSKKSSNYGTYSYTSK